jgi:phosphopantetheinyl transferase
MTQPGSHLLEFHCLELERWREGARERGVGAMPTRARESRRRSAAGRWLIRRTLSAALGLEPAEIVLEAGEHGKPCCANAAAAGLAFNLSHCGGLIVMALGRADHVGLDIEEKRRAPRVRRSAGCFFADEERALLDARTSNRAEWQALVWWVLKEAAIKAIGRTVFDGLSGARVDLDGNGPLLLKLPDAWEARFRWRLAVGPFAKRHLLAVAVADDEGGAAIGPIPIFDPHAPNAVKIWRPDLAGSLDGLPTGRQSVG